MLELGALLALNFNTLDHGYFFTFGFPFTVYWQGASSQQEARTSDSLAPPLELMVLLIDVGCCGAILAGSYRACENAIRRRELQKLNTTSL